MFRKMKQMYGDFRQTLEDGHYCAEGGSFWSDLFGELKEKLPPLPKIQMLKKLPMLGKLLKSKIVWTGGFGAMWIESVVAGAITLAAAGISFYAMEYVRCRHSREQIISEVNFAGQTVRGRRKDLSRLHKAQEKILSLSDAFNDV